ncbi:MAG: glycosyltransferase, partial [Planctomycetota bacterium]|nr:glycosyltransferase [Planctomycetota bacterium]
GARICGFPYFDADPAQLGDERELEAFLASGSPPVVFTLGTAVVHVRPDFFGLAARAAAMAGCRAVLVTGSRDYVPTDLPGNIATVPYARFSTLFERARVIVHHGGIGTTAQAMRAGKPTVIVPAAHDQFDNAARAVRLGVSRTVKLQQLRPDSLNAAIREVADDQAAALRVQTLAQALRAERGACTALDSIEQFIAARS